MLIIVLAYGYYFFNKYFGFSIPCIIHLLTGFYCPGCGITRMFFSILKLNFYQAFRYNPLLFIILILYLIYKVICIITKKNIKIPETVYYILVVILILYGIIRNIPLFSYLKPTII